MITSYYTVLGAYAVFYFGVALYSLKDINDPVWNHCDYDWNGDNCKTLTVQKNLSANNLTLFGSKTGLPTQEFWDNFIAECKD